MNEQNPSNARKQARKPGQLDPKAASKQDETQLPVEELSEEELEEAAGGTVSFLVYSLTKGCFAGPPSPPTYK